MVVGTTLLSSRRPLVWPRLRARRSGAGAQRYRSHGHFTGRSDNFDPTKNSLNPDNARRTEGIRCRTIGDRHFG
jgi:hypothetical protein